MLIALAQTTPRSEAADETEPGGSDVELEVESAGPRPFTGIPVSHPAGHLRQAVERDGELTETELADFNRSLRDQGYDLSNQLQKFRSWLVSNPEKMEPAPLRARHKEEVLKYLDRKIRDLEHLLDQREQRENAEADAKQAAATLPSVETLEKIQRYETKLERQQYRAMAQLERLQRMRRGEAVPAPISMVV